MDSVSLDKRICDRGKEFFASISGEAPSIFNKGWWTGKVMDWSMKNENFKVQLFRFVDVLPYLNTSESLSRHIDEYFAGDDQDVPKVLKMGAGAMGSGLGGKLAAGLVAKAIRSNIEGMAMSLGASRFIEKPIDTEEFLLTIAELLSQEQITIPMPLPQPQFYSGYRARLETKLQHKNRQIARIERLLPTLDPDQKASFKTLYEQALRDRNEIQVELDALKETIRNLHINDQ